MKKIALLILLGSIGTAYAQQPGNYTSSNRSNNYNSTRINSNSSNAVNDDSYSQIRIIDTSQEIRADVLPFKNDPKIKNDRYYYWYFNNVIHSTQGGYNGQLLNGHYIAFYPDKNLKEEGNFNKGLKDGIWKTWNRKGDLTNVTTWDEGIAVPDSGQPFWKKIPFLNKKDNQQQASKPGDGN
jgi:antitoxin component YwqK of YwqJK toxin-antitoxin module